jgi:glucosamine-6-phosphate deaminase
LYTEYLKRRERDVRIVVLEADAQAAAAADLVAASLADSDRPVLGVATGSSPLALYADLAARVRRGGLDLSGVDVFALDEYLGATPADPWSYSSFVSHRIIAPLGIDPRRVHVPKGDAADPERACADFEQALQRAGGVDVQIAGIGTNGHLAFNEPGSPFDSRTRVVPLSPETRSANARFFDDPRSVPSHAVTQGIGTVLEARRVVVVAAGPAKAAAVRAALEGPCSTSCPASALQQHPDAVWFLDQAASSLLERRTLGLVEAVGAPRR